MNFDPDRTYDATVIAIGSMVETALQAARQLGEKGVSVLVFHARFLAPLDEAGILDAVRLGGCVLTLEDGVQCGGMGSCVADLLARESVYVPVCIKGLPNVPVPHGKIEEIHALFGMDSASVCDAILHLIEKKGAV